MLRFSNGQASIGLWIKHVAFSHLLIPVFNYSFWNFKSRFKILLMEQFSFSVSKMFCLISIFNCLLIWCIAKYHASGQHANSAQPTVQQPWPKTPCVIPQGISRQTDMVLVLIVLLRLKQISTGENQFLWFKSDP